MKLIFLCIDACRIDTTKGISTSMILEIQAMADIQTRWRVIEH